MYNMYTSLIICLFFLSVTRPKDNRLDVHVLQAPPHVSNVPCVCAMPALVIDCVYTIIFE